MWAVELKSAKGVVTDAQDLWLCRLEAVESMEVGVWRPAQWTDGTIEEALR